MPKAIQQQTKQLLSEIAKIYLSFERLEIRSSDTLNFHDINIWSLKEALQEAYESGKVLRG